jgi:hypothetical protein
MPAALTGVLQPSVRQLLEEADGLRGVQCKKENPPFKKRILH